MNDLNTNGNHGLSSNQHGNMPRVPSLDFLRQLVTNQHNFVIAPTIPPGTLGLKSELPDSSIMPILPGPSALSLPHLHSNDMNAGHHPSTSGPAHEAAHHTLSSGAGPMNPAAAAAAALHLGQLSRYTSTTQASAQHSPSASPPQNEPIEKTEIRRARRCVRVVTVQATKVHFIPCTWQNRAVCCVGVVPVPFKVKSLEVCLRSRVQACGHNCKSL